MMKKRKRDTRHTTANRSSRLRMPATTSSRVLTFLVAILVLQTNCCDAQPDEELETPSPTITQFAPVLDVTRPPQTEPPVDNDDSGGFFDSDESIARPVPTIEPTFYIPPSVLTTTQVPSFAPVTPKPLTKPPSAAGTAPIPSMDPFLGFTPTMVYTRPNTLDDDSTDTPTILYEFGQQVTMEPPPPSLTPSRRVALELLEDASSMSPTEVSTTGNTDIPSNSVSTTVNTNIPSNGVSTTTTTNLPTLVATDADWEETTLSTLRITHSPTHVSEASSLDDNPTVSSLFWESSGDDSSPQTAGTTTSTTAAAATTTTIMPSETTNSVL